MTAYGHALRPLWALEDGMTFLNHGSYGATPRAVAAEAERWRARMEAQPVRFFTDELPAALRNAAAALAAFVGCAEERLGFVENASAGTNAVLASIPFAPGDEILTTTHVYNALRNNLRHVARRTGAVPVEAALPLPIADEQAVVAALDAAFTPRTRLLVIDHVTSASALILPLPTPIALARARGVPVLVDGAHGPGMLDLDVDALGADWYVGNCHKWLCAPKGAAFIVHAPHAPHAVHPTVISHSYGQGFAAEFDKIGTRDHSPWLAVPASIDFHQRLGGAELRTRNIALARQAAAGIAASLGTVCGGPAAMTGAIATIRLPWDGPADWPTARALRTAVWQQARIELHVTAVAGSLWARISAAAYNQAEDYDAVAPALRAAMVAMAG